MIDVLQVLWSPIGESMPTLGGRALVDVTDGDTPNIRMPVRMLSIDTPEVTARTPEGAARVDARFAELAQWIADGRAPISAELAAGVAPKLDGGGTRQFTQGKAASAFEKQNIATRLARADGTQRNLFIRTADTPFDANYRLLAYLAPDYSPTERAKLARAERSTFNLDMVAAGWAATFVIFPSIPGEQDLPLLVDAAATARTKGEGAWGDPLAMPGYEYRAMERLHTVTKKIVEGKAVAPAERFGWRERYCVDMRSRVLHGPEAYGPVPPEYRLWVWPADVRDAVARLNLTPAPELTRPR